MSYYIAPHKRGLIRLWPSQKHALDTEHHRPIGRGNFEFIQDELGNYICLPRFGGEMPSNDPAYTTFLIVATNYIRRRSNQQ